MVKPRKIVVEGGQPPLTADRMVSSTGAANVAAATRRLNEILLAMFEYQRDGGGDIDALLAGAITSLEAIAPRDEVESMLSTQMITAHLAAMECLKRAAVPEQTFEGRQSSLKHAHKFMSLYLRQVETLDRHRGKGRQKITVEHVNVEAGGQAIVGNVSTSNPQGALEHAQAMPMAGMDDKAFSKRRKRRPRDG